MNDLEIPKLILSVLFYRSDNGIEPVRNWLKSLSKEDRKSIGEDIKTVQYGWPIGMPIVRKLDKKLWEVRSQVKDGIVRVIFTVINNNMILLHGFIKKSRKTPKVDIETAKARLNNLNI